MGAAVSSHAQAPAPVVRVALLPQWVIQQHRSLPALAEAIEGGVVDRTVFAWQRGVIQRQALVSKPIRVVPDLAPLGGRGQFDLTVRPLTGRAAWTEIEVHQSSPSADDVLLLEIGGERNTITQVLETLLIAEPGGPLAEIPLARPALVAGAGVPVAKHGNRALSSRSGAADVLTALGVRIDLTPDKIARCIREAGIGFMFAPAHHPAMKNVAATRVELGTRTIFNLLGPLSNPAGVRRQMVGVFSRQWTQPLAQVLKNLGAERVWVVHGSDGLDEITTAGPTSVAALENGTVTSFEISPEEVGLPRVKPEHLRGGDAEANANALRGVLEGTNSAFRDVALFNAAAALVVAGKANTLKEGLHLAVHAVDSGEAEGRLDRLIVISNDD
jgi:anthranilate phosphoribosyltransferase